MTSIEMQILNSCLYRSHRSINDNLRIDSARAKVQVAVEEHSSYSTSTPLYHYTTTLHHYATSLLHHYTTNTNTATTTAPLPPLRFFCAFAGLHPLTTFEATFPGIFCVRFFCPHKKAFSFIFFLCGLKSGSWHSSRNLVFSSLLTQSVLPR